MSKDRIPDLAARLREAKLRHMGVAIERFPYDRCPEREKLEWEAVALAAIASTDQHDAPDPAHAISFSYTNWRGEHAQRRAVPISLSWGNTDWHPEDGWLLEAWDHDKQAVRQFALADCDFTKNG